jgi:hypothetical protein
MSRPCLAEGCRFPRWAFGYCKEHQNLRTDDQYIKRQAAKKAKQAAKFDRRFEKIKAENAEIRRAEIAEKIAEANKKKRKRIQAKNPYSNAEMVFSSEYDRIASVYANQVQMFKSIWASRPHVSFLSGKPLNYIPNTELWYSLFAHVLSKAMNKYPAYKLYEKNIVLLTPTEHGLLDAGTIDQRIKYEQENNCCWNKIFLLAEELKGQYPELI